MFRLEVELQEKVDSIPVKNFGPLLNIRRFVSRGDGESDVYELVSRVRDDTVLGEIWKGIAKVELGGYVNDEVNKLEVERVMAGYYFTQYFKVTRTQLIETI
ncbi:hypothetical protein HS5_11630 [Acidianus sp. HS-5]|nr:hypothetical protein HS5_11630 [Acidianus sp. HS-5]